MSGAKRFSEARLKLWTKPVRYRWSTPDGTICHGSTVLVAWNRQQMHQVERRFWHENKHVEREAR